ALVAGVEGEVLAEARLGEDEVGVGADALEVGGAGRLLQLGVPLETDLLREAHDRRAVDPHLLGELAARRVRPPVQVLDDVRGEPLLLRRQRLRRALEPREQLAVGHLRGAATRDAHPSETTGTAMSSRGAYCCAPKMSLSPGLPLGRSRRIVNLIALAGSKVTKSVMRDSAMP